MGKPSQRKGRAGEHEAAAKAAEFDLRTRVHTVWEALDISIEGDAYEVKRCEQLSLKRAYDALHAGARGLIARVNRQPWVIALDYLDWLEDQRELNELRSRLKITITKEGRRALKEIEIAEEIA